MKKLVSRGGIVIMKHGRKRGKERGGLGGNSAIRFVDKAFFKGINFRNAKQDGKIYNFLKNKYNNHKDGYGNLVHAKYTCVYGRNVYVIKKGYGGKLYYVCMLDLPRYCWDEWDEYSRAMKSGDKNAL